MSIDTTSAPPLRLGLTGCGKVVEKQHLPALKLSQAWSLAAACDPSPERRRWAQAAATGLAVFETQQEMLGSASLDAVLIASPPATHVALATEALQQGLHVLVEKPMSLRVADAERLVETALQQRKLLLVGFNRRFHPAYARLYADLQAADPSSLSSVVSSFSFDPRSWGTHLSHGKDGGGVLEDVACHQIDLLSWLLHRRASRVRVTYVHWGTNGAQRQEIVGIEYELHFGGVVATCTAAHGTGYREDVSVSTGGKMLIAGPTAASAALSPTGAGRVVSGLLTRAQQAARKLGGGPRPTVVSCARQLDAFAASIRSGTPHVQSADMWSGLYSVRVVDAARESLRAGGTWQRIELREGELNGR